MLHPGTPAAGAFGCWKRSIKANWHGGKGDLSQPQWETVRRQWREAEAAREQSEAESQAKARDMAAWIMRRAKTAGAAHPYLVTRAVKPAGEQYEYRHALALPLRDAAGTLHSLQFIAPDGAKRFLTGGRIAGCFFTLADKGEGPLVIAEGFATAASIAEATGLAAVAAMNCGNLPAVASALRAKWPQREMILAADNDAWTPGNPGITKATEAAKAIRAKLGVPQFKDTSTKPTDFNDLHQLEGLNIVKTQIEAAATPKESDEETIARLAKLPLLEYERCRDTEAERLGIKRVSTLDKLVDARRPKSETAGGELQGRTMSLADVESWPESVSGADVLNEVAGTFAQFVALPDGAADALALWTAHTHCFELFQCSPRLNVSSPEKGCGKTTLRDVLAVLVPRPLLAENLSVAVLFRVIEAHRPTVLADECDSWLRDNDELRGMLNSGHRRGGQALRCEGESNEVRAFAVFAPAVVCGIGSLPGTLHDRSIVIRLERAKPGELRERFDSRRTECEQELCAKLARFCADNSARLEACDPALPSGAFNRLADNWRPLFAVAEIAGGDWPHRAAAAFAKLTNREDGDAQGIGVMLLADIQHAFADMGVARLPSAELCDRLATLEGQPWAEYGRRSEPITANQLAKVLRRFGVQPRNIKLASSEVRKGYYLEDFQEAFERYLPSEEYSKRYPATIPTNKGDSKHSHPLPSEKGSGSENEQSTNVYAGGSGVADGKRGATEGEREPEEMLL